MGIKVNTLASKVVLSLVMVLGLVVASGIVPSVASAHPKRYCTPTITHGCLKPFVVTVTTPTSTDCRAYFTFNNPNNVTVPRSIAVFHNGTEVFGDDDFLTPGQNPPLVYGPFADGQWRFVVSSYGTVFANEEFNFNCGI